MTITELHKGEKARVLSLKHDHEGHWRKLAAFGILPGALLELRQKWPGLVISVGFSEIGLDEEIANLIEVEIENEEEQSKSRSLIE
ncbi:MAG TPA: FeoA family protein [Fimbriimonadales bacterium]|nr:FeoA family protein [Fimbriimonadales bacterium]